MNEKERTPAPRDRRVDAHRDVVAAARPCAIGIASLLKLRTADHRSALAVARCVIAALLGRFLPRLGPLAIASGPFFFSWERERSLAASAATSVMTELRFPAAQRPQMTSRGR